MKKPISRSFTGLLMKCPSRVSCRPIYPTLCVNADFSSLRLLPAYGRKSYSSSVDASTRGSEFQRLADPFKVLPVLAPAFPAVAADISVITQPKEFFEEIKVSRFS